MWFCDNCHCKLYEEYVYVSDIVAQLPPIFDRFYGSTENRTCDNCGAVMPVPSQ
jgi:3-hydroxyanthranilate 3,4-dioxygenase